MFIVNVDAHQPCPRTLYTHAKPEPVRLYPDAIVRPAVYTHGAGNVLAFATSLGYKFKHETYKRGFIFRRGIVSVFIYQLDMFDVETMMPEKAPIEATWTIEARTPPTDTGVGPSIQALLELRALMKGLVDLERMRVEG
ncbi:hypothetical protein FRC02_001800 [Tulasnella sp. 418]|nr:hypothetical protein FRC02_001800 [Tulasnella sp. 418]